MSYHRPEDPLSHSPKDCPLPCARVRQTRPSRILAGILAASALMTLAMPRAHAQLAFHPEPVELSALTQPPAASTEALISEAGPTPSPDANADDNSRGTETTDEAIVSTRPRPTRPPIESEVAIMGMIPDGDYRLFSATVRCNAWTLGVEYDRNSWGHIMKSRVDYSVEIIPLMILSQPKVSDFWGNAYSPNQQYVYGTSISPFGFRFLWRENKAIRPFVIGKLGAAAYMKKAFSQAGSYANFNVQSAFGIQFKVSDRVDLRVEPFEFFHVSNGYLAASNPGMDELATRIGFSYHLNQNTR